MACGHRTIDRGPGAVVLALARRHGLSVHAEPYLELARRQDASLASLDPDLRAATRAEAVPVIG